MITIYTNCQMCGRKLKSEESKLLGFGPTCYSRYLQRRAKKKKLINFGESHDEISGGLSKQ